MKFSAGAGSHGAAGGRGGTVEIAVDEAHMNLLFAVDVDTSGGAGGAPGRNGRPGAGGLGGKGGKAHEWSPPQLTQEVSGLKTDK